MSNAVFPTLNGIEWNVAKAPIFATNINTSVSGKEVRLPQQTYPRWQFKLSYSVLNDITTTDLRSLVGFFLSRQGSYDNFLYNDSSDNAVGAVATGNGTTKIFTVPNADQVDVFVNGTQTNAFTVTNPSVITFTNAPTNNYPIVFAQPVGQYVTGTSAYQLARTYGGFVEPVQAVNVLTNIYQLNGSTLTVISSSNYSLSSTGIITFSTPPTNGASLYAVMTYYYRCRFVKDSSDFNQFMYNLWEAKSVEFITEKL